jgi:hypothetical protein
MLFNMSYVLLTLQYEYYQQRWSFDQFMNTNKVQSLVLNQQNIKNK